MKMVNLTLDICSDRRMRAHLGMTALTGHYIVPGRPQLCSSLLSCERFSGSHTGDRIAAEVSSVLDHNQVKTKVDYIIINNAANMSKTMTTVLAHCQEESDAVALLSLDAKLMPELLETQGQKNLILSARGMGSAD